MRSMLRRFTLLACLFATALPADGEGVALYRISSPEASAPVIRLDRAALAANPDLLLLPLPDGTTYEAARTEWADRGPGSGLWQGDLETGGYVLLTFSGLLVRGTLRTPDGRHFQIEGDTTGRHRLAEVSPGGSDTCGVGDAALEAPVGPIPSLGLIAGESGTVCFFPSSPVRIDLMALYVDDFVGPQENAIRLEIQHNVDIANMIFSNSDVRIVYRLVYVGPLTQEQPPAPLSSDRALTWLRQAPSEVERLRTDYGADMVSLMIPHNSNRNCGIAVVPYFSSTGIERMWGVGLEFVDHAYIAYEQTFAGDCTTADYTFAHEHGHNFGFNHELEENTGPLPPSSPVAPHAYGYRFQGTQQGATVMGCDEHGSLGGVCSRVPYFSNPNRTAYGVPLGSSTAYNACVANNRATRYANFRSPPPDPVPAVQITSPASGAVVAVDTLFPLNAAVHDDTALPQHLKWGSDLEGSFGSGSSFYARLSIPGSHLITAQVSDQGGKTGQSSIRVEVAHAPRAWAGKPAHNQTLSGSTLVSGWATAQAGVASLSFKIDNTPVTLSSFSDSVYRPDVCTAHAELADPSCPFVGWQGVLDTTAFSNGIHYLRVTATSHLGLTTTFSRRFVIDNVATVAFAPVADSWVWQLAPTSNYGSSQNLHLRASGSGAARHAYLKFSVSGITRPVRSAKLRIRTGTIAWPSAYIYRLATTTWNEGTITWNNAPLDPLLSYQLPGMPANVWVELDVTPFITGNGTYTIGMVAPDQNGYWFFSRESIYPPLLTVTY